MMWDFSGGAVPPNTNPNPNGYYQAPVYPGGSSFPMPVPAPAPFMPIGGPSPPTGSPSYSPAPEWAYAQQPNYPTRSGPTDHTQPHQGTHHTRGHYSSHHTSHQSHSHRQHRHRLHSTAAPPALTAHTSYGTQASNGHTDHPTTVRCSNCTGKRKAVCIGINYTGQPNALYGCVNDAKNVHRFLTQRWHYKDRNIRILTDESSDERLRPTRRNIIKAMEWLVRDAQPDDSLFFHYSGHGAQVEDKDGDEVDGYDEVIFPMDYKNAGYILDDEMNRIMVSGLPEGCRLTALFDSCHSGSILDLPYLYHSNGRVKGSQVTPSHRKEKGTRADVISWSGCTDSQTSADTYENGAAVGAMSYAFMAALKANDKQSYQDLLKAIRDILKKKYSQKPQLSSSYRIDTNLQFIM